MGLSIKHDVTEAKVRELARLRRQSMTRVVHDVIDEALTKESRRTEDAETQARLDAGRTYVARQRRLNAGRTFPTDAEMDGWVYDEAGHPVR